MQFANEAARNAFAQAITSIEASSACEAVVAIRRQSAAYLHVHMLVGTLALFSALAFALYAEAEFSTLTILLEPFIVGVLLGAAVEWLPALKRLLTPRRMRRHVVERAARATFFDRGVSQTTGRTGILFYISWQERIVSVVPDIAVRVAISSARIAQLEQTLSAAISQGGEAVATAIQAFATELAVLPRSQDDLNELPDAIDAQLHRSHHMHRAGAR